jgi:hypothetical protein
MGNFWKIAKAGLVMFAVGVALATVAPTLFSTLSGMLGSEALGEVAAGAAAHSGASIIWTGAFFGTFGALHAAIAPIFDKLDGTSRKAEIAQAKIDAKLNELSREPAIAPEMEVENYFRQQEEARRAAPVASTMQI